MRRQWSELAFEKKLSIVVVPLVVALLGIAVPVLQLFGDDDGDDGGRAPAGPAPSLEIVDLAVTDGDPRAEPRVTQAIDLTLRNRGDLVAIVTGVSLRVRETAFLEICQGGGGLEVSETYDVLLPPDAEPGQVIESKVSQELAPGAADRFVLRLDVPDPDRQLGQYLYQLDVLVSHDAARTPLRAGTVLVSAPFLPTEFAFYTPNRDLYSAPEAARERRCSQRNESTFRDFLALDGERQPGLSEQLLAPAE
jgi:hypothetical protein